jgi:hypothetical protein
MIDANSYIGIAGLVLILLAFALNLFHKISPKSVFYNLLNIAGSGILAYYAVLLKSMPFLVLQLVWGILSLFKLISVLKK